MSITNEETRMQTVVQAITQYHPSFADEIRGCSPAEISQLQAAVGWPLPPSHVEFLQLMGHSTEPLQLFQDSDVFSFGSVLAYHSNKDIPRPPKRYLLFGLAEGDPYFDFYLDCGSTEPQVVRFPTPETVKEFPKVIEQLDWLASSLYEFIFSRAFFGFHISRFPQRGSLAENPEAPIKLEQERAELPLKKLGFTRHPQSSAAEVYYERPTSTKRVNGPFLVQMAVPPCPRGGDLASLWRSGTFQGAHLSPSERLVLVQSSSAEAAPRAPLYSFPWLPTIGESCSRSRMS